MTVDGKINLKSNKMERETIYGQVVSKANNYQVGNDSHGWFSALFLNN